MAEQENGTATSQPLKAPDPENIARAARVRAARAHAAKDQAEVAKALGISVISVKRMEKGTRQIPLEELQTIADLCDVPLAFMTHGFAAAAKPPGDDSGVCTEVLEHQRKLADEIHQRFDSLAEALSLPVARAIAADSARRLTGD